MILILAVAVILTLSNNNPIAEANRARYESDRANMQVVFTLTVGKVMTQNRATVSITAGQINDVITGVKETTGEVSYTVKNAMNSANSSGEILFDKGTNTDTAFYTGKKLPIYAAGDTKWYVDNEGNISLEVAGVKYGSGNIEIEENESITYSAGLYDKDDNLVVDWDTLVNTYGMNVEKDYFASDYILNSSIPHNILTNKIELASGVKLVMSDSVTSIGNYAFRGCSSLTSVVIPNSVTSIRDYAFYECTGLTHVVIPNSVISIGSGVFSECSGMMSVEISDNVNAISPLAFYNCKSLNSVTIPNKVTAVGNSAFYGCTNLVSVLISNSVNSIGRETFYGCTNLVSLVIPESVNDISPFAFYNCTSLTSVMFEDTDTWYVGSYKGATTTKLNSTYLADTSTAAAYLNKTRYSEYWTKK